MSAPWFEKVNEALLNDGANDVPKWWRTTDQLMGETGLSRAQTGIRARAAVAAGIFVTRKWRIRCGDMLRSVIHYTEAENANRTK